MNSSFRITNASDEHPLNVGVPKIQKIHADKKSDEFKVFVEPFLKARKLSASTEDEFPTGEEEEEAEWLQVEPHSFQLTSTPLTRELLAAEERARRREAARQPAAESAPDSAGSEPELERRKVPAGGRGVRPAGREVVQAVARPAGETKHLYRRSQAERTGPDIVRARPPERAAVGPPSLPTAPIPASELPPTSVRSPPPRPAPINPLLQGLKPIPPSASPAKAAARPAGPDLISIQVPMAGPDGSQTLQTINVPRSVLAGASDRPILLTVTPKNGVNKGQKQIVVLTKNTSSASSTSCTATISTTNMTLNQKTVSQAQVAAPPPAAARTPPSPTKPVQLSPRQAPEPPQLQIRAPTTPATHGTPSTPGTQVTPATPARPALSVPSHAPATSVPSHAPATRIVRQQPRPSTTGGQQVIKGHIVQTSAGQVLVQGNKQILLGSNMVQGGKLVLSPAQLAALTGGRAAPAAAPQQPRPGAPQARLVAPQQAQTRVVVSAPQSRLAVPSTPPRLTVPAAAVHQPQPPRSVITKQVVRVAGQQNGTGEQAGLSRILSALHNRGLVSQQNGKFYYVGDKSRAPVSLSPSTALKLAGVGQQGAAQQSTVVVGAAASLASYTADPALLEAALSAAPQPAPPANGSGGGSGLPASSFQYRDRALPAGWSVRVDTRHIRDNSYQVETQYRAPGGPALRSQREVVEYLAGQGGSGGGAASTATAGLPWKENLSDIHRQFVPNIDLVAAGGGVKRPLEQPALPSPSQRGEKKPKPDSLLLV